MKTLQMVSALLIAPFSGAALAQGTAPGPIEPPKGWFGVMLSDQAFFNESGTAFFDRYPVVSKVEARSPASKAGVKPGDVLMNFNSHDMRGATLHLNEWLKPGAPFVLRLRRGETVQVVRGTVEPRPEGWKQVAVVEISPSEQLVMSRVPGSAAEAGRVQVRARSIAPARLPMIPGSALGLGAGVYPFLGAEFTALNADLCEMLGVKPEGVFVTNVEEGSIARESGLRGGDVVIGADGNKIENPNDLVRAIRLAEDRTVRLDIIRKRKPQTITLNWQNP